MISLHSPPFTLLIKLDRGGRRRLALPQYAVLRRPGTRSVRAAAVAESVGAELRRLARDRVASDGDDRLLNYETLLVDRFLDILQELHGSNFRRVVRTHLTEQQQIILSCCTPSHFEVIRRSMDGVCLCRPRNA
jgi:phosphoenolpyruvate carboxylase